MSLGELRSRSRYGQKVYSNDEMGLRSYAGLLQRAFNGGYECWILGSNLRLKSREYLAVSANQELGEVF